jgi:hypothetical protein
LIWGCWQQRFAWYSFITSWQLEVGLALDSDPLTNNHLSVGDINLLWHAFNILNTSTIKYQSNGSWSLLRNWITLGFVMARITCCAAQYCAAKDKDNDSRVTGSPPEICAVKFWKENFSFYFLVCSVFCIYFQDMTWVLHLWSLQDRMKKRNIYYPRKDSPTSNWSNNS